MPRRIQSMSYKQHRRYRKRSREELQRYHLKYNPYPKTVAGTRGGIFLAAGLMILFALILIGNLFRIQIISYDKYAQEAAMLHYQRKPVYPERGSIIDSTGKVLAVSNYDYTVGVTPYAVRSWLTKEPPARDEVWAEIGRILGVPRAEMDGIRAQQKANYVLVRKGVSRENCDKLKAYQRANAIGGIAIDPVMQREYPIATIGSSVVGFTSKLDETISGTLGVEAYYDDVLRGKPGYTYTQVDNFTGMQLPFSDATEQIPVDGNTVQLNLNIEIQDYCEKILKNYMDAYNCQNGGEVIVMNPKTGAVLAMANHTTFNLNEPYALPEGKDKATWKPHTNQDDMDYLYSQVWLNRSVSMLYEPGSTFKGFTVAMGLEEKAVSEEEYFCDDPIWVDGWDEYPISCWNGIGHGYETLREALVHSCNPIMVQVSQAVGREKFFQYVRAFGHEDKTKVDLPAEAQSILHPNPNNLDMAVLSFGEQNVVTPLQLLSGYTAFANDGVLMRPQVVDKIISKKDGSVVQDIKPEVVRRVISSETATKMMDYLRSVVTEGGAPDAETAGYGTAGKTSTSTDGEFQEKWVISFAGFAPYDDPKVAVLVVLHEPNPIVTSEIPARLHSMVTSRALEILGVPKNYNTYDYENAAALRFVPDMTDQNFKTVGLATLEVGIEVAKEAGAPADAKVKYQYPPIGTAMNSRGTIYYGYSGKELTETVEVPDFSGLSFDAAYRLADRLGLNLQLLGAIAGNTVAQSVPAGTVLKKYSVIQITLG